MTWKTKNFDSPMQAVTFMNNAGITLANCLPLVPSDGQFVLFYYN